MNVGIWVDWVCIGAFAMSGVFAARDRKAELDLFGVVVVAVLTAIGGGTLRDIILQTPVFWLTQRDQIYCPILVGVLGFFLTRSRQHHRLDRPVALLDAVGLAYFTVMGTQKALLLGAAPFIAVLMGLMTGVSGGMMRDAYTGQVPYVMRRNTDIYATTSLLGGIVVVLVPGVWGLWLGGLACFGLRVAAIRWKFCLPSARW